jgi:hypothetical protein
MMTDRLAPGPPARVLPIVGVSRVTSVARRKSGALLD